MKASAEELIIVPDMHEAIVTEEEFYRAGEVIRKSAQVQKKKGEMYPLRSLVYCGNCGRRMQKRKMSMSFICGYTRTNPDTECSDIRWEDGKELEQIVFRAIRDYIHLADKNRKKAKIFQKDRQRTIRTEVQSIAGLQEEIARLKQDKLKLYEKLMVPDMTMNQTMHVLFALEDRLNFELDFSDDSIQLVFREKTVASGVLYRMLCWMSQRSLTRDTLLGEDLYDAWRYRYPAKNNNYPQEYDPESEESFDRVAKVALERRKRDWQEPQG